MRFVLTEGWAEAAKAVSARLQKELAAGRRVLWLVSGGSQVLANVEIIRQIPLALSRRLSIMPADERYGPVGHDESNWAKLLAAGFEPKQATLLPVLANDLSFEATAERYGRLAGQAFEQNDVVLAQLGLGADGHTAGILPGSPAGAAKGLIAHYEAPPLKRLTLTFNALRKINAAYVLAFGPDKKAALEQLKQVLPLETQPAQILRDIPEAYIYNDQVGD